MPSDAEERAFNLKAENMEQWKDVPGYEGRYQVSDMGRVKSVPFRQRYLLRNGVEAFRLTRERILAQQSNNRGYLLVHLHLDNSRRAHTVHRLVADAFLPNPNNLPEVDHRDRDRSNAHAANLRWSTVSDNRKRAQ